LQGKPAVRQENTRAGATAIFGSQIILSTDDVVTTKLTAIHLNPTV